MSGNLCLQTGPKTYMRHYKIKDSCAVVHVCWISPGGRCRGTGRPAGRTGIKIIENKGLNVCWNQGNRRVWLAVSDCRLEKVVGLFGELPYGLSLHTFKRAIGHYPLTESVGTTAKGTAQLCFPL